MINTSVFNQDRDLPPFLKGQAWAGNWGRPPGYRYSNPHGPTENLIA